VSEIPILIFHGVRDDPSARPEEGVIKPETFARQMAHLRRNGYYTATIGELLDRRMEGRPLPQRSVALTFDDASSDHWYHVFPILSRYELRATFFVPTHRPGKGATREGSFATSTDGSMRWSELEHVAASGLVEVEAHSHFHDRHIAGPRIRGFCPPDDALAQEEWGRPIYEDCSALVAPRFDPDLAEAAAVRSWIEGHGGRDFFTAPGWEDDLGKVVEGHRRTNGNAGLYEAPEVYRERVIDEFRRSRQTIEQRLGRQARFMAWPHGGTSPAAHAMALEAGFSATVASTRLPTDPPSTMFKRTHFGEDYRGPLESTVQLWRFVRTVEAACGVGIRHRLSPLLRPWIVRGGSRWSSP
jgi:peptidoglycan/xylan/chitin deacetylase (PgdA/CDA1 family)